MALKRPKGSTVLIGAIKHRKVVYLLTALLIAVGLVGLDRMNRDEFPTFEINQGLVAAVYPGATAEQVAAQVVKPLEDALMSYQEVNRQTLRSVSRDGICYFYVDLVTDVEKKDEVWSKLKLKLQTARMSLPAGVLALVVLDDFSDTSALLIAMESSDKGYTELYGYAEALCERLRRIPELASAKIIGRQTEEIAVTLDLDRLATYGISPASLLLEYQTASLNTSGGTFVTDYAASPVSIAEPVTSEQAVAERIIYTDPQGNALRLKDVATIERRYKAPDSRVSYNGRAALVINVCMRPNNNIVKFGQSVEAVIEAYQAFLPDSVRMSRITDQPKAVHSYIFGFLRDLLISMLVVIFVMLLLFPMRSALIAGSGVPVCTGVTLAIMYVTGMQLNTVTLAALIVVLGMIVDDSIITMDGYMDKLSRGLNRTDAAVASARELFMPMFMATFAISVMFFPAKYLITGYLGFFIKSFPWIIAIALACSLVYAMLVVPSLEVRFIGPGAARETGLSRMQNRFFGWMQRIYDHGERFCFRHPGLTLGFGVTAIVLGVLMFLQLNIQMIPKANRDCFAVEVFLDNNSSFTDTEAVCDSLTRVLLADARVEAVTSFIGEPAPRFHATYAPALPGKNVAQMIVNTRSNKATVELIPQLDARYEHAFPGALVHFKQMDYQASEAIDIALLGAPAEALKPYADSIRAYMYTVEDLKFIRSTFDDRVPAVQVELDPDEASRYGVNKALLGLSVAGAFEGRGIATLYEGERKIPVNLYSSTPLQDMTYDDLAGLTVPTLVPGVSVPLEQVATVRPQWRLAQYQKVGGQDVLDITADMRTGKSQPAAIKRIKRYIQDHILLPEGASVEFQGLSSINGAVMPQIGWSFLAAVSILFLFLLLHFRKLSIAVLTMVLSLLCLFGASFGLWFFRMDFSITAVLGLISLVGIIVRNGIIMFEYAEELRFKQGYSVREAAFLAGQRRMRPIFLTSCTTALGVLPMILSGDLLWMPMGVTIAFGTMLSIFLVVLIMPVSYWQLFKKADKNA